MQHYRYRRNGIGDQNNFWTLRQVTERKRAEERQNLLISELDHRASMARSRPRGHVTVQWAHRRSEGSWPSTHPSYQIGGMAVAIIRVRTVMYGRRDGSVRPHPLLQSGSPINVKAAQSLGSGELSLVAKMADLSAVTLLLPPISSS